MLHLHVNGEPIRVLHLDKDKCEALIVFRETTQKIPLSHLVMIADSNLETVEELQELLRISGVGVSGDSSAWNRASLVSANFYDSDLSIKDDLVWLPGAGLVARGSISAEYLPMSVGDLSLKKSNERTGEDEGKDVNPRYG